MNAPPSLEVHIGGRLAGLLSCEAPEIWRFRPQSTGAIPGLPAWSGLAGGRGSAPNARAWFRHLLPDGAQCVRLAQRFGVSVGNEFALFALLGRDCQGNLSFAAPAGAETRFPEPRVLTGSDLARLAAAAGEGATAPELEGTDYLLPGPRGQFPCLLEGEDIALAGGGRPGAWLGRIGREGLQDAVDNETLCMGLAAELGLPVPASRRHAGAVPLLLTARIDCVEPAGGGQRRRHVENFGQLAGLHPEQAYEREGGLAIRDCVNLLRRHSAAPAVDLRTLLRWLVYCFMAGVGQAHAKCLFMVATPRGARLALGGGLLSTHVYPALSEKLAMSIGGEDRPDWIRLARWLDLADELGVGRRYLLGLVAELATQLPRAAERIAAAPGTGLRTSAVVQRILTLVANRARQTAIALAAERV